MHIPFFMIQRKYFHPDREPSVTFTIAGRIHLSSLISFWDEGLEIRIMEQFQINAGVILNDVSFGSEDEEKSPGSMIVERVIQSEFSTIIEVKIVENEGAIRLTRALHFLREPQELSWSCKPPRYDKIPRVSSQKHYSSEAINERLQWARDVSGAKMQNISNSLLKPASLAGNIENYIGAVQVPVGMAGPLLVKGTYTDGYIPLPIATTEGALVSSISRGALVCGLAGGVHVSVTRQQMVRAPVFFCESLEGAVALEKWIHENISSIKEKAESVSSIARLEKILPLVFGNALHLRFYFKTGDAAGQNMTSACTWMACEWIAEEIADDPFIGYQYYYIESNMSGDKKANAQNFIEGRGLGVTARCFVSGKILKRVLRVDQEAYLHLISEGEFAGTMIGMVGSNINFSNVIAGLYTSTGQDIACVHESSCGIFKGQAHGDGILFSAYLPSLIVGTVGGGTKLPIQKECLEVMGCYGSGKLFRFAEIIAAACLALDISTGAAIVSNDFVRAHEKLGRNRPLDTISRSEINEDFFTDFFHTSGLRIIDVLKKKRRSCSGIISTISGKDSEVHGLYRYQLTAQTATGKEDFPAFLKLKASGRKLMDIGLKVAKLTGEDNLPGLYESQSHIFCVEGSHIREMRIYTGAESKLLRFCPKVFGTKENDKREIYAILMEDLSDCALYDSIDTLPHWDEESIKNVLTDMASMHAVYFENYEGLEEMNVNRLSTGFVTGSLELLTELTVFNSIRYPERISDELKSIYLEFLEDLEEKVSDMMAFPMTLTHNDFNPRNLCLRKGDTSPRTVLYDWELAFIQNPQHDLIEFLVFVLEGGSSREKYLEYARFYLNNLERETGRSFFWPQFVEVLDLNSVFFAVVRMNLYLLGNNIIPLTFLDRVYSNLREYIIAMHHCSNTRSSEKHG